MFYRFFRISLGFPCLLSCPWACPGGPVCWNVPFGSGMGIGGAGTAAWHWPFMAWRKVDSWSRTWLYMLSTGRCIDIMLSGTAHAKHDCNCIAAFLLFAAQAHGSPEVPNPMAPENLLRDLQMLREQNWKSRLAGVAWRLLLKLRRSVEMMSLCLIWTLATSPEDCPSLHLSASAWSQGFHRFWSSRCDSQQWTRLAAAWPACQSSACPSPTLLVHLAA